jgi:hypothetical protein
MAQREVLKWIMKREAWLAEHVPKAPGLAINYSYDSDNDGPEDDRPDCHSDLLQSASSLAVCDNRRHRPRQRRYRSPSSWNRGA